MGKVGSFLGAIAFTALASSPSFALTVYNVNLALDDGASAVGMITTDGTFGLISWANIVDYNLTLSHAGYGFYGIYYTMNGGGGTGLVATSSTLSFDFSSLLGYGIVFGGDPGLGFEDSLGSISGHPDTISFNLSGVGDPNSPVWTNFSGLTEIGAAAVPLPAGLPLLAAGLGVLGFLGWRKKRSGRTALAA